MRFFFSYLLTLSGAASCTEALCYKILCILVLKILTYFQKNRTWAQTTVFHEHMGCLEWDHITTITWIWLTPLDGCCMHAKFIVVSSFWITRIIWQSSILTLTSTLSFLRRGSYVAPSSGCVMRGAFPSSIICTASAWVHRSYECMESKFCWP